MAYKFQRGTAVFDGALVQETSLEAISSDIKSAGDIVAAGAGAQVLANDDITINHGDLRMAGTDDAVGAALQGGKAILSSSLDKNASLSIKDESNNLLLKMGSAKAATEGTLGHGFLGVYNKDGNTLSFFSGSGNGFCSVLQAGDDLEVNGNVTVAGDLTVNGSVTRLNVTNIIIDDGRAQLKSGASNLATSIDSGFTIGSAANKGHVLYKDGSFDSDVSEGSFFGLFDENIATNDYINVSASSYYGDGSNVTGIASAGTYSVSLKAGGEALVEGVNYITAAGSSQTVTMLDSDTVSIGAVVRIKSYGAHSTTNKVIIQRDGDDTIEGGTANIELESPFASITLVKTAANTWNII